MDVRGGRDSKVWIKSIDNSSYDYTAACCLLLLTCNLCYTSRIILLPTHVLCPQALHTVIHGNRLPALNAVHPHTHL